MEELSIASNYDGLILSVLISRPKKNIKGIVQISHGMAEHKERYIPFMKYLNKKGYITIIHDHRGHGKSIEYEDDLGYFYDSKGIGIVEDLHQITEYIKSKNQDLPVYLLGHSMGSIVAQVYLQKYDKDIEKLIVCGTPSYNNKIGLGLNLVNFLGLIKKGSYRSRLVNDLVFGEINRKFKNENIENAWLCRDRRIVRKYNEDNLCGFIFTLNGFKNLFSLMRQAYVVDDYLIRNPNLQILFMAGSLDAVIIDKKSWEDTMYFLIEVGYPYVKGILYREMRHEILNELGNKQVYEDILEFIEK